MGINVTTIKNEALQKLANEVDVDKNGVLNKEECASLFEKINAEEQKFNQRLGSINDKVKSNSVILGGAAAYGGIFALANKIKPLPFKGMPALIGVACAATGYIVKNIAQNSWSEKLKDLEQAKEELNTLLQDDQTQVMEEVA